MVKILADAGTSWTKIIELYKNKEELIQSPLDCLLSKNHHKFKIIKTFNKETKELNGRLSLIPTKEINQNKQILFDAATGHMSMRRIKQHGSYENELIAMALGGMKVIKETDAIIVDIGSRDSKWIKYKNKKYSDLDWNGSCGSGTGATIEMLCRFYDVDSKTLESEHEKITVTCGVFGMEKIMDMIAKGISPRIAISRYIHGIAFNVWNFARRPDKIYLSGGLCLNNCFVNSLQKYCEIELLGRYLLLEGLY